MHDGMPYGWNQGQGHSREVDRQSPTGLIFKNKLVSKSRDYVYSCWVVIATVHRKVEKVNLIDQEKSAKQGDKN